jgi:cytochrome c5
LRARRAVWRDVPTASCPPEDFMSDAQHSPEHDGPHEGPIRTPKQLIVAVFFSFVVPIFAIVLLVMYVTSSPKPSAGSEGLASEAVAGRIAPVGWVAIKDASDVATLKSGEQVYQAQCVACHAAGAAGAPKFGDTAAWAARIKTGYEALLTSALKGKNAMGAQGGGDFSDVEIGRAVVYMANKGGAKFDEPKLPAAPATATPPAAAAPAPAAVAESQPEPKADAKSAATTVVAAATPARTEAAAAPALYGQSCVACHAVGVAGAPKLGDKAAWAPRLVLGVEGLTASAIKGKNAMPPRGGSQGSDADIKATVAYMVNAVK